MKKTVITTILCSLLLTGCTNQDQTSQQTSTQKKELWHVYPSIDATSVTNMLPFSNMLLHYKEYTIAFPYNIEKAYNAFIVQNGDSQSIYDYDGNLLYTLPIAVSSTINQEGLVLGYAQLEGNNYFTPSYGAKTNDSAYVLSQDFTTATQINSDAFMIHPFDGNQIYDSLAVQNDKIGILSHSKNSEGEDLAGYTFEAYTPDNLPDLFIAQNVNSKNEPLEKVIVDASGKIHCVVQDTYVNKSIGQFVSGFYPLKNGDNLYALASYKDGKPITEYAYKNVGYFMDGYCPVQNKDDKWAYIDEEGNEVTEYLFDGASSLYEGKAVVIKDGKVGILNLKENVSKDKLTQSIYDNLPDTPTATPEISQPTAIGKATINIESINIRKDASASSEKDGTVTQGQSVDVYETKEVEGYTWYRIGENQWIASDGTWLTYTPNS